jgi:hypothetical protein
MNDTADNSIESIESQTSDSNLASDKRDKVDALKQEQNATEQSAEQPLAATPKRRIAIGTQRSDTAQPDTASRYTYVTSEPPSNAADTPSASVQNSSLKSQDGPVDGEKKTQRSPSKTIRSRF